MEPFVTGSGHRLPAKFSVIIHGDRAPILAAQGAGLKMGRAFENFLTIGHAPADCFAPWGITLEVYDALGRLGSDGVQRWRQLIELQRRREAERQQLSLL